MSAEPRRSAGRAQIQTASLLTGALFALIGILGFIPGITQPFSELGLAGQHSEAFLLGIFQVSVLHNLVHLAFGVAGLVAARTPMWSRNYLLGSGIIYLALFLYGVVARQSGANFIPVNKADNALHIALGLALVAASFWLDRGAGWRKVVQRGNAKV